MVEYRPSPEFNYEAGKTKLIKLEPVSLARSQTNFITPGDNNAYEDYFDENDVGSTGRQGKLLRLSASVDLESHLTVGCAGAVLTYIGRKRAVDYLPGDVNADSSYRISTIEMFNLKDSMSDASRWTHSCFRC